MYEYLINKIRCPLMKQQLIYNKTVHYLIKFYLTEYVENGNIFKKIMVKIYAKY